MPTQRFFVTSNLSPKHRIDSLLMSLKLIDCVYVVHICAYVP